MVWPSNVSVNVPPVALLTRTVWVSSVFMSLNGPQPPELPLPAGVSSPVTSHRLFASSKSMSPATWQHAPRSTWTFMIFCSDARSSDGVAPSTNLKRESWKYPRQSSHAFGSACGTVGAAPAGVVAGYGWPDGSLPSMVIGE